MTQRKRRGRPRRSEGRTTRDDLLKAAETLFAAGGYEATSLRQIASTANVDIATLKYHFQDKPTLFAEVYSGGHQAFLEAIAPVVGLLHAADDRASLRHAVDELVTRMQGFIASDLPFIRLVHYRILEDSDDVILEEEQLQNVAIAALSEPFIHLAERGVIPPVDARAVVVFLIASFMMWNVTARSKASWLGGPSIETPEGQARSQDFLITSIHRMLGIDEPDDAAP